jgi:homopolymeric O-antigen transport system permease protein
MSAEGHTALHVIEPPRGWPRPDLRELWRYRDLVYHLARRDLAIRYRQTVIGAAWAIVRPVAFAAVFASFVTLIGRVPTEGVPYAVFALTGMSMWLFISGSLTVTASSTVASSALVSKVYFPRLTIPIAAIVPQIVDLAIAFVVLLIAIAIYGVGLTWNLLALPAVFALALVITLGAGLWLAAYGARYRDLQHVVPFIVQIGLFVSPVLYPLELVPDRWQALYSLNPAVGVLEAFRWCVLGTAGPGELILIPIVAGLVLFGAGLRVFARAESRFADDL